jgi:hypothetical protein
MNRKIPIEEFVNMWPRELFDCKDGKELLVRRNNLLKKPGVYVLYRNDVPYYVGKAKNLRGRLRSHANQPTAKHYKFWNYFSAFVVKDAATQSQLEGILIAAMPTANGAKPRIKKAKLPANVRRLLHERMHPPIPLH